MTDDIYSTVRDYVLHALRERCSDLPDDVARKIEVGPARDPKHGDASTNAAFVVASLFGEKPQSISASLSVNLSKIPGYSAEAAGGFTNIRLPSDLLRKELRSILRAGEAYGDSSTGAGRRIDVEYVSANPTGPMHIGHCRGAGAAVAVGFTGAQDRPKLLA